MFVMKQYAPNIHIQTKPLLCAHKFHASNHRMLLTYYFCFRQEDTMIDRLIHHRNIYWMRNNMLYVHMHIIILCAYSLEVP